MWTVLRILGVAVCVIPTSLAIYAWFTHWHWQRTGAYSQNSFPMNKLALDLTLFSCVCIGIVACSWVALAIACRKSDR